VQLLSTHFVGLPEIIGLNDNTGIYEVFAVTLRNDNFSDSHGQGTPEFNFS
jgi:hypothetical protein